MQFEKAINDENWSKRVKAKNGGKCLMCNRESTPAHIFGRGILATRLIIDNGVPLCFYHHHRFDSLSSGRRKQTAILFIGGFIYNELEKLVYRS